jgi:hypothetical protein
MAGTDRGSVARSVNALLAFLVQYAPPYYELVTAPVMTASATGRDGPY